MKRLLMITILFVASFSASMCDRAPADTTTLSESTTSLTTTATTTTSSEGNTSSSYITSGMQSTTTMTTDTTNTMTTISTEDTETTTSTLYPTTWTSGTETTSPTGTATTTSTTLTTMTQTTTPTSGTTTSSPTTTSTTTTTMATEMPDTIAEILLGNDGISVRVTGVVYYVIATPERPGYYLYDGTGFILVIDSHPVTVGDGVTIDATFDIDEPAPQLIDVTSFSINGLYTILPTYEVIAFADIVGHSSTDRAFHGKTILVTGVVGTMGPPMSPVYYLSDAGSTSILVLNEKSFQPSGYNPFSSQIGQTVTIQAVVHAYEVPNARWHILVANESDPNPVPDFLPGEGGTIPAVPEFEGEAGKFGGLYVSSVDRHPDGFGGFDDIVDLNFPLPSVFGATSYTLEYWNTLTSAWVTFQYQGVDCVGTSDNFSLIMNENLTLRLRINEGDRFNHTSNEVSYTLSSANTYFSGWSLDSGMHITGIMSPGIGYGLLADFTVRDSENAVVEGYLTYQWYRVNPVTFEATLIADATALQYATTAADVGYYLMIRAQGDGIHVGGIQQVFSFGDILPMNEAYATDVSTSGFTLNFFYLVGGMNPALLQVMDNNFTPVTILGIVPGINLGQYVVTLDPGETTPTSFSISYYGDWVLQARAEEGFMHQMLRVEITVTE